MPDYRSMYDRDYIGHFDLPGGKDTTLTIKRVVGGELTAMGGRKSKKPIVHFAADVKPLICNKTNGKTIAAMYGNEVAQWVGKRVTLFVSMTRNPDGGGEVECIRIRPKIPQSKADTTIAPPPEPEERIFHEPNPAPQDSPRPLPSSSESSIGAHTGEPAGADHLLSADQCIDISDKLAGIGRGKERLLNAISKKLGREFKSFEEIAATEYHPMLAWIEKAKEKSVA